jgi:sigma-B regulation protein RsbU (phosphoserine phosphatase)
MQAVAGHPQGLVRRRAGHIEELGARGGIPLGIEGEAAYHDVKTDLGPRDLLLLYTDGVVEAVDTDGNQFGLDRLKELLARDGLGAAETVTQTLHNELMGHCQCRRLEDDVTVLAVQRLA